MNSSKGRPTRLAGDGVPLRFTPRLKPAVRRLNQDRLSNTKLHFSFVHRSMFTKRQIFLMWSLIQFVAIWLLSLPLIIGGGFEPAFGPSLSYPVNGVIGLSIFTLLETGYLYGSFSIRTTWFKTALLLVYALWGFVGLFFALTTFDMGGLPFAHSAWVILSAMLVLWLSIREQARQRAVT